MRRSDRIEFLRSELPYGVRVFQDGTAELFNRRYETLAYRRDASPQWLCEVFLRNGIRLAQEAQSSRFDKNVVYIAWFYDDSNPPCRNGATRRQCERVWTLWHTSHR